MKIAIERKPSKSPKFKKPRPDFPLFVHQRGYWAKKVRGETLYFGKIADDPDGVAAEDQWSREKDDRLAGRVPRPNRDGLTIALLCDRFLNTKRARVESKEITQRHFDDLHSACDLVTKSFGKTRLVIDLAAEDFETLRAKLGKTRGAWALSNAVQKIRSVFKYAYDVGLILAPVRLGSHFKRPSKSKMRRERAEKGVRLFEAADLKQVIDAAGIPLKAMVLLGVNCGLGNSDCGNLKLRHLDLDRGWLTFPRPKTGIDRKCKLWPETVKALETAIDKRPAAKDKADAEFVFITKYGTRWAKDAMQNPVSAEFRKLLVSEKLHREGLSFYTLRHQFETVAGGTRDQVAVDHAMGHADPSMGAMYRERIGDDRLEAIANHVHAWLFPRPKKKATTSKTRAKAKAK